MQIHEYWIGLGSNLGDKRATISSAITALNHHAKIRVQAVSPFYLSAPIGPQDQPCFLNAAACIRSSLLPHALLRFTKYLEKKSGRIQTRYWGERTLDIDILFCDSLELRSLALELPHPRMHERAFVLAPLSDLNCAIINPQTGQPVSSALRSCQNQELWLDSYPTVSQLKNPL